ncbi:MAG: selenium-binding protein SBP56-related protein [Myxococcota bacterium]|nr:selenium-binding protein SBP56-related protein [Myxococcota bacterium]
MHATRRLNALRSETLGRLAALVLGLLVAAAAAHADETCQSPYMPKLSGQEDYIYVWTLGVEGWGDGSDKVVSVGANPARPDYGKIVHSVSVGGRHEAHHGGLTDDRRHYWVGGLDTSQIYIFDIATDPARPKLVKTIDDFVEKSGGVVGPHGFYALPGRMLIPSLSNDVDKGGKTAIVEYSNEGEYVRTTWMPEEAPYGYDARVNAHLNRMLTSSFTGHANYMRPLAELMGDAEAMKNFGNEVVVWDFHARKPLQVLTVPGAPLEIRWALNPIHEYAFIEAALTGELWGVFRKPEDGTFEAVKVGDIGPREEQPLLAVDISLSADDTTLFVDTFMDGKVRVYDVSDPRNARQIYEKKIGSQVNMVSQSWDGKRVYFTSSLLANWDGTGHDDEQFLKAYDWNGKELIERFAIDFREKKIGRPHIMRFGQIGFHTGERPAAEEGAVAAR